MDLPYATYRALMREGGFDRPQLTLEQALTLYREMPDSTHWPLLRHRTSQRGQHPEATFIPIPMVRFEGLPGGPG